MTARTNDLECWKLFCLVVEKQGLNAAADFADIEPSRLSRVINSLEAELGSPLLVHNRRPLQTTSFGDQAYAMAKALLAQHALMLETLKGDKDRMEGLITLAIPAGIGPLFVTPQLLEFQQIFPKIEFELITLTSKAEEVFYNHPDKVVHVSIGYGVPGTGDIVSRYSGKWSSYPAAPRAILKTRAYRRPVRMRSAHRTLLHGRHANKNAGTAKRRCCKTVEMEEEPVVPVSKRPQKRMSARRRYRRRHSLDSLH